VGSEGKMRKWGNNKRNEELFSVFKEESRWAQWAHGCVIVSVCVSRRMVSQIKQPK